VPKKNRFNVHRIDHTLLSMQDDETLVHICLTPLEAAICKVAIQVFYWPTRWVNLSWNKDTLEAKMATIDYRLNGGCFPMIWRQSPVNPCWLEVSYDDGVTWTLAFDFSLCSGNSITTLNTYNEWNEFNEEQNTTYAGDIINNYPAWEYGDPAHENVDREVALCFASMMWVEFVCQSMIAAIERGNAETQSWADMVSNVSSSLGFIGLALAGIATFATGGLIGGIGLLAASLFVDVIDELFYESVDPYTNEENKALIACIIYQAMTGQTPDYDVWSVALTGGFSGDLEHLRKACYELMQSELMFVNFLGMMVDVIVASELGLVANVCSDVCTYEHTDDFVADGMCNWFIVDYGEFEVGVGWKTTVYLVDNTAIHLQKNMLPDANIYEIEVFGQANCSADPCGATRAIYRDGSAFQLSRGTGAINEMDDRVSSVDSIVIGFDGCDDELPNTISKVIIRGYGVDPF